MANVKTSPVPSVRTGSRGQRSRSFRYGSFSKGRPGFRESADFDFSKPAYGTVPIGEGKFYWVAFRRLRDWMDDGEPLESGCHANGRKVHDNARAAIRPYLSNREPLPPMPDSWVLAYYDRLMAAQMAKEAAVRWLALLERDDGTIAGYDWETVCEDNGYAEPDGDDTEAQDMDVDEAA